MTDLRVTTETLEVVSHPTPDLRVTSEALESVAHPTHPPLRVTAEALETVVRPPNKLRVTAECLEIVVPYTAGLPDLTGGPFVIDNVLFPVAISYGATGGPSFKTTVVGADSGGEQREANWKDGRLSWEVGQDVLGDDQLDTIIAFFRARRGKQRGFLFQDPTDHEAVDEVLDNTVPALTLQARKTYTSGGITSVRKIVRVNEDSLVVKHNGVVIPDADVDPDTGIISLPMLYPGEVLTWSGIFYVVVRFDTDDLKINRESWNINNWTGVPIIELRVA